MTDETYMRRALELAEKGAGWVSPNPLVGAVIVKDEEIIGEDITNGTDSCMRSGMRWHTVPNLPKGQPFMSHWSRAATTENSRRVPMPCLPPESAGW